MKQSEFVKKLWFCLDQKTLYATGAFGAPLTQRNKDRYHVSAPVDPSVFMFDCVGLYKAIEGNFSADSSANYGGTDVHSIDGKLYYGEDNVPDYNETTMFNCCTDISTDFSRLDPGEAVWMNGHIGFYVGCGLVIECSPAWENGVQLTACNRDIPGFNRRNWLKHGKLPWIQYGEYEQPIITYQVFDKQKNKYLPAVKNTEDYAGIYNDPISLFRATPNDGKIEYWVKTDPENWLGGTYNGSQAGLAGRDIYALMIRYDRSQAHYRVRANGVWLPTVSGCNPGDADKGYAGDDKNAIDAVYVWCDPVFHDEDPATPENPATDEPTPSDPTDTPPENETPAEREKMRLPAWFYDFVKGFCDYFANNCERGDE